MGDLCGGSGLDPAAGGEGCSAASGRAGHRHLADDSGGGLAYASDRLTWLSGNAAQCDLWFPPRKIPREDGSTALLSVTVITDAHSRLVIAKTIPTQHKQDLPLAMWLLLPAIGRVPRGLIWDNESGIGRGKQHAEGVGAFTGTLATRLIRLEP